MSKEKMTKSEIEVSLLLSNIIAVQIIDLCHLSGNIFSDIHLLF